MSQADYSRLDYWAAKLNLRAAGQVVHESKYGKNAFSSDSPTLQLVKEGNLPAIKKDLVNSLHRAGFKVNTDGSDWRSGSSTEERVVYISELPAGTRWSLAGTDRKVLLSQDSLIITLRVATSPSA